MLKSGAGKRAIPGQTIYLVETILELVCPSKFAQL